jgi:hypothetical protein
MNVTLSLAPDTERDLKARAEARGLALDAYLREVLEREVSRPHISERIRERMSKLPAEILANLPKDGARQHDHYIYGLPKRRESE